jgi:hypothetical protein
MDRHVGRYPYESLTIVDPAFGAEDAGGMEYPMLVTTLSASWLPRSTRLPEAVTIHEVIHQYWQGIVANNEAEEAWVDEGVTQYYEDRVMDQTYGQGSSFVDVPGFRVDNLTLSRTRYTGMKNHSIAPIATPPWEFRHGGYGAITYSKTATVLATLQRLAGNETMDSAMRTYFRTWSFRHPRGTDFLAVVSRVISSVRPDLSPRLLASFFQQLVYGTGVCDYEVTSLSTRPSSGTSGLDERNENHAPRYASRVVISRLGEVQLPVDVLMRFSDGSEMRGRWDGMDRTWEFRHTGSHPIQEAVVDPDGKLLVDINVLNNSRTTQPPLLPLWDAALRCLILLQALAG